ncbi:methyltransferase [Rhabdobacter roseus]|uniref:tRNA1(Val) (adenine(37)-N6)-methyltransferase n=1 Tax=Rhabdobacter roseus TaxID=1655419 RepID=A0A840TUF9_9BACT|nr:methyltransferase [Rhabdobacter roseus]MBB5286545.1 tRNA1Val (adenine37-N6)-methyltransferase [Rhabdobacter roseus]
MPRRTYFQFKQFTVQQERCAMKVCTDACVLGAWAEVGTSSTPSRVLDIGTGTGLLALMAAQRNPAAHIDAVELNAEAAEQARANVAASPFAARIRVVQVPIQAFVAEVPYDFILTNPPFYQSDLRSPDAAVNQAHHATSLTFTELLTAVERLLTQAGTWSVLLPVAESEQLQRQAEATGWVLTRQLTLAHQPGQVPFRRLGTYRRRGTFEGTLEKQALCVYEADGSTFNAAFRYLLRDFYLPF